ncbi:unnamed protein product [Schistocephalus solidus]|uniref:Uncharacterized protein n=1 Tax=Schistocephalus solidus TaxID=70667 RepID=A0A183TDW0_SCHSO|nr:unnamed protein product [Schistocephalus solidus]
MAPTSPTAFVNLVSALRDEVTLCVRRRVGKVCQPMRRLPHQITYQIGLCSIQQHWQDDILVIIEFGAEVKTMSSPEDDLLDIGKLG